MSRYFLICDNCERRSELPNYPINENTDIEITAEGKFTSIKCPKCYKVCLYKINT